MHVLCLMLCVMFSLSPVCNFLCLQCCRHGKIHLCMSVCLCCEMCCVCSAEQRTASSEQAKRVNRSDAPKPRSLFSRGLGELRVRDRGPMMSGSVLALFDIFCYSILLITAN